MSAFTEEQLDNWFTYHPPTTEQVLLYTRIGAAETECLQRVQQVVGFAAKMGQTLLEQEQFEYVNAGFRSFADFINEVCPPCADTTVALRALRLARNFCNEFLRAGPSASRLDVTGMGIHLRAARFQANSAIACGGK